jgi:predicted TIM-barrel fold metal-dependent hydrolase
MIVDVQAHLFPAPYMATLEGLAKRDDRSAAIARATLESPIISRDTIFTADIQQRLSLMDEAGVDVQVLSFPAPNVWSDDVAVRRTVSEAFNDGIAEVVTLHRRRFALMATLPLPFVDASIAEAERALQELGAVGFSICTHFDGTPIDDPRFNDLYAFFDEREATVLLHPEGFFVPGALADHGMEWAIGTPFDDTIAAIRLIYGGLIDRYPSINWIVPHLGGTLPFLAERLDFVWNLNPHMRERLASPPTSYLERMWFDTVNPDPRAVALTADVVGTDRLLYGSDFPFAGRRDLRAGLSAISAAGLSDRPYDAAAGLQAARLLGIDY